MSADVLVQQEGGIATVVFNRPRMRNAISLAMWGEIGRITEGLAKDDSVRAVVYRGAGHEAFASGADISEFEQNRKDTETALAYNKQTAAAYDAVRLCPKPTVAMVFGFCNERPDPGRMFHKHLDVTDYYRGGPGAPQRLGSLQQVSTPPYVMIESRAPFPFRGIPLHGFVEHLAGALAIAEDEPQAANAVRVDWSERDAIGLPRLEIRHAYSMGDEPRRRGLVRRARRILQGFRAWACYAHPITTFSHAVGTVRMGRDESAAPLDEWCRFRGLENLRVVDGSVMPTSGAVNPSLTIAALALRAADHLVREDSA